jgi:hypothetical protein
LFKTGIIVILLLIALALIVAGIYSKRSAKRRAKEYNDALGSNSQYDHKEVLPFATNDRETIGYLPWYVGLVPLTIAVIFAAFACTTIVESRSDGVPVAFGRIGETMDNGLNFHAPWVDVSQMDATNKTSRFVNSNRDDTENTFQHGAIDTRLSDNSESTTYATARWHRTEGTASDAYAEFRGDDPLEELRLNLINSTVQSAVVEAMATYNPTESIDTLNVDWEDPAAVTDALKNLDLAPDFAVYSKLATDAANRMLREGRDVPLAEFDSIIISKTTMPERSQDRIDAFFAEVSDIQVALARRAKNAAQAQAANELKESLADNPLVIVSRCFDLIETGRFKPPVGFQCWSGGETLPVVGNVPVGE